VPHRVASLRSPLLLTRDSAQLGRFILLNLFLAILLSNFSGNDEEPEGDSMGGYDGEPEPKGTGRLRLPWFSRGVADSRASLRSDRLGRVRRNTSPRSAEQQGRQTSPSLARELPSLPARVLPAAVADARRSPR
jgi:hypothetical protein